MLRIYQKTQDWNPNRQRACFLDDQLNCAAVDAWPGIVMPGMVPVHLLVEFPSSMDQLVALQQAFPANWVPENCVVVNWLS